MTEPVLCQSCPRLCSAPRQALSGAGFCRTGLLPLVARAAPHYGEEPCISGSRGSGTVFFSGCNLRCVFCQNHSISAENYGKAVTVEALADIFRRLEDSGVHNLSLVTASHFPEQAARALELAKPKIPVVWNSSGYDSLPALKRLEGLVQIYMPDLKYMDKTLAARYSAAPDYPETAAKAILEMYRQTGDYALDEEGLLRKGLLIRHLILPGSLTNSFDVMDWVSGHFSAGQVLFSLMGQYTPMGELSAFPELQRTLSPEEYAGAESYMSLCGIRDGFVQELDASGESYIPDFDLTGI